ncbi:MAG: competence protein ComEC [Thermosipho sp. (in: thermotogales)]|nr:competence protein ComEC [Thermosipho sp. (in: thermotogales)]MDN5324859.1 competence protein ComEC [Thermosipho sp. (in: thermotogales)]
MVFLWFFLIIIGALIAPIFSIPRFLLLLPLIFYKKPFFSLGLFVLLIVNYIGGINISGEFEFVGRVIQTNDNFSLVRGKVFYKNEWKQLNTSIGIYDEIPIGDIVYYFGEISSEKFEYPKVILNKNRVIISPSVPNFFRKIYVIAEDFRNSYLKENNVLYGLFGGKVKNDYFFNSGLYHFFSISGAHISLLFSFSFLFFSILGISKKISNVFSLLTPLIFIIGTGLNLPALRAFMYLLVLVILELIGFKFSKLDILCVIGISFLIFDPSLAFSLSFYMTFFSTLGIISVSNKYLKPIAAFLGSAPYLSLFASVNVFSIIGSFVAIIPIQILLILLSLSFLFYLLNLEFITKFLLFVSTPFVSIVEKLTYFFSLFPHLPKGIFTYFLLTILFFIFLLHFGQIPYILKSKSSKINP